MNSKISSTLERQIQRGIEILKKGGVIAFPTDTLYGLGADAFNSEAVDRVYEIKQRPRHLAFPLLLADISQITFVAESVPEIAWFLSKRFLPGGLTLVLPKSASLPSRLGAAGATIAVRIPDHPVPIALIRGLGTPIIGTSANISGRPSPVTAQEVKQQLGSKVDFIIDGGRCPGGIESTVVDVTSGVPVILRQGIIPQHEIEKTWEEYIKVKRGEGSRL